MRIKKLTLYTDQLEAELEFYSQKIGFKILKSDQNSFTIKIGWSELTFKNSQKKQQYHYCFLIPRNQLNQALEWMKERVDILNIDTNKKIQHFENWNADSFYFYDASGNIAEFIVRYDLNNDAPGDFDHNMILSVNEIGMPTKNIKDFSEQLKRKMNIKIWKGNLTRFGTFGDQEGLLLLPNHHLKDTWFPSDLKIKPEPFDTVIQQDDKQFLMQFKEEEAIITSL